MQQPCLQGTQLGDAADIHRTSRGQTQRIDLDAADRDAAAVADLYLACHRLVLVRDPDDKVTADTAYPGDVEGIVNHRGVVAVEARTHLIITRLGIARHVGHAVVAVGVRHPRQVETASHHHEIDIDIHVRHRLAQDVLHMAVNLDIVVGGVHLPLHLGGEDVTVGHRTHEIDGVGESPGSNADSRVVIQLGRLGREGDVQHTAACDIPVRRGDLEELSILTPGIVKESIADVFREGDTRHGNGLGVALSQLHLTEVDRAARHHRHHGIQLAGERPHLALRLVTLVLRHHAPVIHTAMRQVVHSISERVGVRQHRCLRPATVTLPEIEVVAAGVRNRAPVEVHVVALDNIVVGRTHVAERAQRTYRDDGQMQGLDAVAAIDRLILSDIVTARLQWLVIPVIHTAGCLVKVDMIRRMQSKMKVNNTVDSYRTHHRVAVNPRGGIGMAMPGEGIAAVGHGVGDRPLEHGHQVA